MLIPLVGCLLVKWFTCLLDCVIVSISIHWLCMYMNKKIKEIIVTGHPLETSGKPLEWVECNIRPPLDLSPSDTLCLSLEKPQGSPLYSMVGVMIKIY